MISGIFFVNQKGDVLISRFYRDDVRYGSLTQPFVLVCSLKLRG